MRIVSTLVAALFLAACSGSEGPQTIIIVQQVPVDAGDGTVSTPPSGPNPCDSRVTTDYANGTRCGLEKPGEIDCGGPIQKGFVYACADVDGGATRPDIPNCFALSRENDVTRTVCPKAQCLPYDSSACATSTRKRAVACPAKQPGIDLPPPSVYISETSVLCTEVGEWAIGLAGGPIYCCP